MIIKSLLCLLFFVGATNITFGSSDWIPYETHPTPPVVHSPMIPSVTYRTTENWISRPLILTYDWVPYYVNKTIVVERQGFLCKYRTVITQPVVEWIYQPVWK